MPFGIPAFDEAAALMEGAMQDNVTDLTSVAGQAIQGIGDGMIASRTDLNTIQGRLRSKLGKTVEANNKLLDGVGTNIDVQLGNAVVNNTSDLPIPTIATSPVGQVAPVAARAQGWEYHKGMN